MLVAFVIASQITVTLQFDFQINISENTHTDEVCQLKISKIKMAQWNSYSLGLSKVLKTKFPLWEEKNTQLLTYQIRLRIWGGLVYLPNT